MGVSPTHFVYVLSGSHAAPIGTGQRITLEATFIPSENLKNLLERYPVLARCIESDIAVLQDAPRQSASALLRAAHRLRMRAVVPLTPRTQRGDETLHIAA